MAPTQSQREKGSERCSVAGCADRGRAVRRGMQTASAQQKRQRNRSSPKASGRNARLCQRDCSPARAGPTACERQGHAFLWLRSPSVLSQVTSDLPISPEGNTTTPFAVFSRTCSPKSESLHSSVFCHFARLRIAQSIKSRVHQGERPCPPSVSARSDPASCWEISVPRFIACKFYFPRSCGSQSR